MPRTVRFGSFELNIDTSELRQDGRIVPLAPQPARILCMLATRAGDLVTRQQIRDSIWGDDVHVDFDRALNFAIKQIRRALADDAEAPAYIETLRGRGYRFIAPVSAPTSSVDDGPALPEATAGRSRPRARRMAAIAAAAGGSVLLILLMLVGARTVWERNAGPAVESIAVLPLENVSGDPEQEYLADGTTDALISGLGQISRLRVISRTSAMTYKNARKTLAEVARELRVDAIVEGSVQRVGDRVRVNVQLIDARHDRQLWSRSYERDVGEILGVQQDLTRELATQIRVSILPEERERLDRARPAKASAYVAYLKGRYFWNRRNEADLRRALISFEEAIAEDPAYAPAFAGLADTHALFASYGYAGAHQSWQAAIDAAQRALELDPDLADGHASRGMIAMQYEWDWTRASRELRRALELNPGYATARHWLGYQLLLTGDFDAAEREMRHALQLDPLSPIINANVGFCLFAARRYDEAVAHWNNTLDMHPGNRLVHSYVGLAQVASRRYDEALRAFSHAIDLAKSPSDVAVLAHTYARMGRHAEAREMLAGLEQLDAASVAPYYLALVYVGLGEHQRALDLLEQSFAQRSGPLNEIGIDPMFDPIRAEPRFRSLLQRIGLPGSG